MNAIYSFWQAINSTDKNGWKGSSSWYNSMWLVKLVKIPLWDPKHSLWCVEQWMWILQTKIAYTCISKWEQSNLQHIRTYMINTVDIRTVENFRVHRAVVNVDSTSLIDYILMQGARTKPVWYHPSSWSPSDTVLFQRSLKILWGGVRISYPDIITSGCLGATSLYILSELSQPTLLRSSKSKNK